MSTAPGRSLIALSAALIFWMPTASAFDASRDHKCVANCGGGSSSGSYSGGGGGGGGIIGAIIRGFIDAAEQAAEAEAIAEAERARLEQEREQARAAALYQAMRSKADREQQQQLQAQRDQRQRAGEYQATAATLRPLDIDLPVQVRRGTFGTPELTYVPQSGGSSGAVAPRASTSALEQLPSIANASGEYRANGFDSAAASARPLERAIIVGVGAPPPPPPNVQALRDRIRASGLENDPDVRASMQLYERFEERKEVLKANLEALDRDRFANPQVVDQQRATLNAQVKQMQELQNTKVEEMKKVYVDRGLRWDEAPAAPATQTAASGDTR